MNSEVRARYPGVAAADWTRFGYDATQSQESTPTSTTLTNPIHSIFSFTENPARPEGMKCVWQLSEPYGRSRIENLITPVLRLASAMLMSPASVVYIYAQLYGPREPLEELTQRVAYPILTFRRPKGLHHEYMRRQVDKALLRLALSIVLTIKDDALVEGVVPGSEKTWLGLTNCRDEYQEPYSIADDPNQLGPQVKCTIHQHS